ncbi:GTPase [Actinotalea sp.]|uniref:GTPase n=1 Tax=Actinotalea sp. TaxID=1872145 RepID=UPI002C4FE716|nr:GTPase [Actinotalea sp.]HQY33070.1 50S ribosome-binding GTPase [Actinotalea sp.]HRA49394.1 50S ribosome-binding GTPase [Actinotalea sp.]
MAGLSVAERLEALAEAVGAGRDALPAEVLERARLVEERAGHRLRLSERHTVVALAGATGSGKSSLVNALVGQAVATVDVLRPTTSQALAVVQGAEGSGPLLDWLGVRERVGPAGRPGDGAAGGLRMPGVPGVPGAPGTAGVPLGGGDPGEGLVLLDLPDHDSVRTEHRLEAERLVALVDLMVWVLDPQKYADAAVHERYLRPLAHHGDVMLVVLNQVDRLTAADRVAAMADLRRLLAADGLAGVPVLAVSAVDGEGVDALRTALRDAASRRVAARSRIEADVVEVAGLVADLCTLPGGAGPSGRGAARAQAARGRTRAAMTSELVDAFAEAAGVPVVVEAVRGSTVLAARRATGWPPTRWLSRLRADPLRTLHLAAAGSRAGRDARPATVEVTRTSLPPAGPAQVARARAALRAYTDAATAEAPDAWVLLARAAVDAPDDGVAGREPADAADTAAPRPLARESLAAVLDRAVAGAEITVRRPRWWGVVGALQWLVLAVALGGLAWLGALAALEALALPAPTPPSWGQVPAPTLALLGGVVLGLVLAGVARLVARAGARRGARRAAAGLRAAVAAVAERTVVAPVDEVLGRLARCRAAAERAATPRAATGGTRGRR